MLTENIDKTPVNESLRINKTKSAVLLNKILSEPLLLIFGLTGFILCKSLNGSHMQVTLFTMLQPSVGLLILYWSASIRSGSEKLRSHLVWSGIFARVPFLFFPWIENPWIFIACAGVYIFFYRASNPAWMEIIKINMPSNQRTKVYSFASALGYAEGLLIALWIVPWLRHDEMAWRWCFPIAAIIGMASILVQTWIIPKGSSIFPKKGEEQFSFKNKLIKPWKEAFNLMSRRPDFTRFQVGFFLCGFGLMMSAATIPFYCTDILKISLSEFAAARLICMCIGYVLFSKFWSLKLNSLQIFEFMVYVIICFILFAIFLVLASFDTRFLYVAFFVYGIAQAGSHLSWSLSGPIFSKKESSTAFSSINVLMVGVRGCIAPALGILVYRCFSPYMVFTFFILFSFAAIWVMIRGLASKALSTN